MNVAAGGLRGGLEDLAWQLAMNGGRLGCVDWGSVAISAAFGAATLGIAGSAIYRSIRAGRRASKAARQIAEGHAFTKHVVQRGEFLGIRTRAQFADTIDDVMTNATHARRLARGRKAYWKNGVVVIRNPSAADGGTAFAPTNGINYFWGLR